jgi:hypothetical protein
VQNCPENAVKRNERGMKEACLKEKRAATERKLAKCAQKDTKFFWIWGRGDDYFDTVDSRRKR